MFTASRFCRSAACLTAHSSLSACTCACGGLGHGIRNRHQAADPIPAPPTFDLAAAAARRVALAARLAAQQATLAA